MDHDLLVKAVRANTDQIWVVWYVPRWLGAPLHGPDGTVQARDRGTPQGSAVSPVLANLFLHYACDAGMAREFPAISFEWYVDDAVVYCVSEKQALLLRDKIGQRLKGVGLTLRPEKTKIVYCKDGRRNVSAEHTSFTFVGYTFRARGARDKNGQNFTSFLPAISKDAMKALNREIRSWRLHQHSSWTLGQPRTMDQPDRAGLAAVLRPVLSVGAVCALHTHQHLRDAMGPQEIQTAPRVH